MMTATDEEVLEMMEYLSWRLRNNNGEFNFKASVIEFYEKALNGKTSYASSMANDLWASYKTIGMIETANKYYGDALATKALVYALNKGVK